MAGSGATGDGSSSLAGMSKNQLYEIMCQMKSLIEQNQPQAREILIQNPLLTRALFQAQIMLGMIQPPQAVPNILPTVSQPPVKSMQPQIQQADTQAPQTLPKQSDLQEQTSVSQAPPVPVRKQHQLPPVVPSPSTSAPPPLNLPSTSMPSHALQSALTPKSNPTQAQQMSLPQSSQVHSIPPPSLQHTMPVSSSQLQQPLPTSGGLPHMLLPTLPLPPQPRPTSMPAFSHHSQMALPNAGFHPSGATQLHHSQPMFQSGIKPPPGVGPFPQGQPPRPSHPPSHPLYQVGGPHFGTDFGNQVGSSTLPERGGKPTQMPIVRPDNPVRGPPPPSLGPSVQIGQGNQPPRNPPLTPEMEKALLQQVMSLTAEQINLLPPEQRSQVLQLQQMLRQ